MIALLGLDCLGMITKTAMQRPSGTEELISKASPEQSRDGREVIRLVSLIIDGYISIPRAFKKDRWEWSEGWYRGVVVY